MRSLMEFDGLWIKFHSHNLVSPHQLSNVAVFRRSIRSLAGSCLSQGLSRSFTTLNLGLWGGDPSLRYSFETRPGAASSIRAPVRMEAARSEEKKRCAIITGVARPHGIGRHLVYGFMKQGYSVVGVDIVKPPQDDDERIGGVNFHFVQADVGVVTEAERIVNEAVQRYGDKIHVLVNNAAKLPHSGASDDPLKEFTDTIAVNLVGAYALSHFVVPHMPPGNASILHISSTRAHQSEPDTAGYSASKAGLCGLTHSQAISLAGKVRVNTVLPGWINTDEAGEEALRPEDHAWHPVGRVGVAQDVVEMCLFLCDEQRAGFLTGQEFVVDGGVSKKMVYPE